MAKERPISIPVILGLRGKGIKEAITDVKSMSNSLMRLSDTAVKAAVGFAAFRGGQLVANFARDSIEAGRDLQTNLNGLQSVFGNLTPKMVEFTKTTNGIGLSMSEAAKASVFIGSVLKQSGFAMDEVSEQTQRLVRLAADLSLTFGYDVQESLLAMTALFRGEYDPIEKFGVAMKQSEIDSEKAARGLDGLKGSAERLVDQQIRLELLYQRSADSLGAYDRQAGNLRVTQDTLRATFNTMQQIIGSQLLPVVADLTASLLPLVEAMGPILAAALRQVVPMLVAFSQNSDGIVRSMIAIIKIIAQVVTVISTLTKFIINNIDAFRILATGLAVVASGLYALRIGVAVMGALQSATIAFNIQLITTQVALRNIKRLIVAIPLVGWALGIIGLATDFFGLTSAINETGESIDDLFDEDALLADIENLGALNEQMMGVNETLEETPGAAGAATNAVRDFYNNLNTEIAKQQAKMRLQQMGASEGLIQSILGSGQDWQRVFADVVSRGMSGVAQIQKMFQATAAGFDEAMSQWEEEYGEPFRKFKEDALSARDALIEFTQEIEILPSVAAELGQFETNAVNSLQEIEEKLKEAFDNKQLLRDSYDNLLAFARDELNVLRQIERQRDEIIARRDAAEALINSVQNSIRTSGRLVNLFGEIERQASGIDVVEFATRTVSVGTSLKEFRTALITNFVEPIDDAGSKAQKLVSSYRAVVERTREFVDNLKALRALGLDPMLFNQLVEAGVEAGGETARALVEGGADTINELNGLFKELDTLGAELGENTAQVMYGQGQNFVNGIVQGLEDQAGELEISAKSIAEAFTTTFETLLVEGINRAIDAAEAAMARMPSIDDFMGDMSFGAPTGPGGPGGGNLNLPATPAGPRPPLLAAGANYQATMTALDRLQIAQRAQGMNISNTIAQMQPWNPLRDAGSNAYRDIMNNPMARGTVVNVYSPSERTVRNVTAGATTRGTTNFLTSRSALSARLGG